MSNKKVNKVLLIGWDAADWKVINPLIDQGKMPALEKLISKGVMGKLATLDPPLSPMLWTSIATGKTADKHGVLGFVQPDKTGTSVHPVLSTTRKCKAIWNILMQNGYKTNVVGWWPSHPAEPVNGIYVSNFYHKLKPEIGAVYKLPDNCVYPKEYSKIMEELRVHPWELTASHILPFVPKATEIDQEKDHRLNGLAKIIAETTTVHSAATWIMENSDWDFMAVYFDGIDHFGHGFMNFHPPKQDFVTKKDFELYKGVIEGGYIFHDMMLERFMELAGEDTTIILISDHGFHSDHLRPKSLSKAPAAPAEQHSPFGIFAAMGPGIKSDEYVFGTTLLDITPTILDLFGLPIGKDMDGKAQLQIYENPENPEFIDTWEAVEGDSGMHSKELLSDPWAEKEALDQLVALGYIDPPQGDQAEYINNTVRESKFYLARVLLNNGKALEALPILENIHEEKTDITRYALYLIKCYMALERPDDGLKIMDNVKEIVANSTPQIELMTGKLYLQKKDDDTALKHLLESEKMDSSGFAIHQELGFIYLRKKMLDDALRCFTKSLEINPDSARGHFGLARVYHLNKKNDEAIDEYISAVTLLYHFPFAHYYLGELLLSIYNFDRALDAFKVVVAQAPGFEKAHLHLIKLYTEIYKDEEKANYHKNFIKEKIDPIRPKKENA
ncbi:MAG: alkaline phosphatase family protein [Candidatus Delongbacteria bacterium]|nr:alkaline phosphatase family protein [Candidatus Delongbacteria bacterium]MBN2835224.1 alkaline phosphatase family protein [Candidatus Delongbacteria bacterium]